MAKTQTKTTAIRRSSRVAGKAPAPAPAAKKATKAAKKATKAATEANKAAKEANKAAKAAKKAATAGASGPKKTRVYRPRPAVPRAQLSRIVKGTGHMKVAAGAYNAITGQGSQWLKSIIQKAVIIAESARRKTIKSADIAIAYQTVTGSKMYNSALTNKKADATYAKVKKCKGTSQASCTQISHAPFVRMVRASAPYIQKFSAGSLKLLQILYEQYIQTMSGGVQLAAKHATRRTVKPRNIYSAMNIHQAFAGF